MLCTQWDDSWTGRSIDASTGNWWVMNSAPVACAVGIGVVKGYLLSIISQSPQLSSQHLSTSLSPKTVPTLHFPTSASSPPPPTPESRFGVPTDVCILCS